jgi:hypothetical protein
MSEGASELVLVVCLLFAIGFVLARKSSTNKAQALYRSAIGAEPHIAERLVAEGGEEYKSTKHLETAAPVAIAIGVIVYLLNH